MNTLALEAPDMRGEKESRRASRGGAVGEIWLAYLHLLNAKHRAKSPELFRALDAASCAALQALREAQGPTSPSQPTA